MAFSRSALLAAAGVLGMLFISASEARAITGAAKFISIPIVQSHNPIEMDIHPAIVHQQHINRGLSRLAFMAGRVQPSPHVLLSNIHQRLSTLSPALRKRYNQDGIAEALAHLVSTDSIAAIDKGNEAAAKALGDDPEPEGFSPIRVDAAMHQTVTKAEAPTFHNTVGLNIQANDIGYMGIIQIGTPARDFQLIVDSGSADLWVGAEDCHANEGGGCGKHAFLGPSSSSTFDDTKEEWSIRYGSGAVSGHLVHDHVTIGGLTLKALKFGVARNESKQFIPDAVPFDGIMGLAKSIISQQHTVTLVESLQKAGLIKEAISSYKIPRVSDGGHDGEITLGAMNPAKYNATYLVTVKNASPRGFWEAPIESVKVNGKDMGLTSRTAIFDTGTTLFLAPKEDVKTIHLSIPGSKYIGNAWTIPCTTNASFSLTFGGKDFSVDPRDLLFLPLDPKDLRGECLSGISEGNMVAGPTNWLVGDVFLKNVYLTTNVGLDEITIAKLAD